MKLAPTLLIAAVTALLLSTVAFVWQAERVPAPVTLAPATLPSGSTAASRAVYLVDYLPAPYARDGSVDYSDAVRAAFGDAAGGELVLPDFPVLVSRAPGQAWCVLVEAPMLVRGAPCSALVESAGGVQLLRVRGVDGFTLRDVSLRGRTVQGQGLAHGLVQVAGGRNVTLDNVRIDGCDADGIAVAQADGVVITRCSVARASKSALYVNGSQRVRVTDNDVTQFGGHRTSNGAVVGSGIQLSSNTDTVCANNVVSLGTGIGVLVNALEGGAAPVGTIVTGNRITSVSNPTNGNVSCGIRLANGSGDARTQTLVSGNSLRGCGVYGIYVENHHGALVTGNAIAESERAGIVVASVQDALVSNNIVLNSGTAGLPGYYQVQLINQASRVAVRGNELRDLGAFEPGAALDTVGDSSQGATNSVEPVQTYGTGPVLRGAARQGDVMLAQAPRAGEYIGWVCVQSGAPGVWRPFGRIEP